MKYLFVVSAELGYYYKCQRHDNLTQMEILVSNLISTSEYFIHYSTEYIYIVLPICSLTKNCNSTMNELTSYPI